MTTYFDDTFTGAANTLLDAHTADAGGTWTKIVVAGTTWDNRLSGTGTVFKGGTVNANGFAYKTTTPIAVADYQVDVTVDVKSLVAADAITCYGRVVDYSNCYKVSLDQAGTLTLRKLVTNVQSTMATATVSISAGQSHKVSLVMVGNQLSMLFDDALVTPTSGSNPSTDTSFASPGSAGIASGYGSSTALSTTTGMHGDRLTVLDPPSPVPVNTVAPAVSGTAVVGYSLSGSNGTYVPAATSWAYRWLLDGVTPAGSTLNTYTPVPGDAGHTVFMEVTPTNAAGAGAAVLSNGLLIKASMVTADGLWLVGGPLGLGGVPGAAIADPRTIFDDVFNSEGIAGDVEYRLVYFKNGHTVQTVIGLVAWVLSNTSSVSTSLDIGVATEGVNVNVAAVADEQTPPPGVTFGAPATVGAGFAMGDIPPGQVRGLWLRRTVNAGATPTGTDTATWTAQGVPT